MCEDIIEVPTVMPKIFLRTLIFLSNVIFATAQITITRSDLPEAGYTYIIATDTITQVSVGAASPNAQTWNFTNLLNHYQKVPTYDSTKKTPYAGDFPNSDLYTYGPAVLYSGFHGSAPVGQQGMDNGYMFWRKDTTGFWIEGFRADGGAYANRNVYYNPQELLIGTTSTYGSSYQNFSRWELLLDDVPSNIDTLYVCSATKTLTTDAFGSLTTPLGSYPNVVRVHEYLIKVDSIYAYQNGALLYSIEALRDTMNNYLFLSNTISYPACIVHADKYNYVRFTEYVKSKISTANEELAEDFSVQLFPNPAQEVVNVAVPIEFLQNNSYELSIFDFTGKCVYQADHDSENLQLNVSNFLEGFYVFKIKIATNQQVIKKLVISK